MLIACAAIWLTPITGESAGFSLWTMRSITFPSFHRQLSGRTATFASMQTSLGARYVSSTARSGLPRPLLN
jgi:hypothetical protein